MLKWRHECANISVEGLSVEVESGVQIAALRYFDPAGGFGRAVRERLGTALPEPLRALRHEHGENAAQFILAWRSPTETLLLGDDPIAFAELELGLEAALDGCMVVQTGGMAVFRVSGPKAADFWPRLGAMSSFPAIGEAKSGRFAELHVLALCVQGGEILLIVDRAYAPHLHLWMQATAADLVAGFADGCRSAGAVWGGGETPTLKGLIEPASIVLAGSAIGKIEPKSLRIVGDVREDDRIIFLAASGVQTNGLTLCRRIAERLPQGYLTPLSDGSLYGEGVL